MSPRKEDFTFGSDKEQSVKNLTVPLWAVWPIITLFVGGTAYFVTLLNTINGKLDKATSDRWTRTHARQFAHEMGRDNPTVKVPDPDAIFTRLAQP